MDETKTELRYFMVSSKEKLQNTHHPKCFTHPKCGEPEGNKIVGHKISLSLAVVRLIQSIEANVRFPRTDRNINLHAQERARKHMLFESS